MEMKDDPAAQEHIANFEKDGEVLVRRQTRSGAYPPRIQKYAEDWLERKELLRHERFTAQDRQIASSAKNAAWIAAVMALIANIIAVAALIIAYLVFVRGD